MDNTSTLQVLIKVLKQGDGDKKLIESLERTQAQLRGTETGTKKAAGGMRAMQMASSQASRQLLQHVGVHREFTQVLQQVGSGIGMVSKGFLLSQGIIMASAYAVNRFVQESKRWIQATKDEIQSAKDLNWVLAQRGTVLERLAARQKRDGIVAGLEALAGRRDNALAQYEQEGRLAGIERASSARLSEFAVRRAGLGLTGSAALGNDLAAKQAEYEARRKDLRGEMTDARRRALMLEGTLDLQESGLTSLGAGSEEYKKQSAAVEKTRKELEKTRNEIEIIEAKQKALTAEKGAELAILQKQIDLEQQSERRERAEQTLELQRDYRSLVEEDLTLKTKLKGVEDDRVARAIAFYQATGRTADASRLLTLELNRQSAALNKMTAAQSAGAQIAALGGINVEALAGGGANLQQRSLLRNLGAGFNQDLTRERNRLRRSGVRDPEALQQQLSAFAAQRLGESPTLTRALGVGDKAVSASDKERADLLKNVDITKAREDVNRKIEEFVKTGSKLYQDLGVKFDKLTDWQKQVEAKLKLQ